MKTEINPNPLAENINLILTNGKSLNKFDVEFTVYPHTQVVVFTLHKEVNLSEIEELGKANFEVLTDSFKGKTLIYYSY